MQPPRSALPAPLDHEPFSTREATAAGVGRGRLRNRDLEHPFHGVYSPASIDLGIIELCTALQRRLPAHAFFSGASAAKIYGIPLPHRLEHDVRVHVGVPAPLTAPVGRGVAGHSYRVVDRELGVVHGLRVSSPARTWCELSVVLSLDELIAAGDRVLYHRSPLASRADLGDQVYHFPARVARVKRREAFGLLHDRSESPRETLLRLIIIRAGLRGLQVNFELRTSGGYDYRADLAFPDRKVLIEYQSAFHDSPKRALEDMTRRSRLTADGWIVIEVNSDDLWNPVELIARIRTVLGQ